MRLFMYNPKDEIKYSILVYICLLLHFTFTLQIIF